MDTLVIGLDGGEWDVVNPLIEEGKLPNIARLKEEGVSGPLESITPPVSPPAWNSIHTGTNPGKHGIFDFGTFDENYNRRSINSSDRCAVPFWRIMNDEGVTTGLFKVPFTYPPDDVSGFMVTGFPTANTVDDFAVPPSLTEQVGPVEELFEDWSLQRAGDYEGFKRNLIRVAERQTDLFLELLEEYDTDLSMTVYDGSDRVQHFFWKYFDETHPRYEPDSSLVGAIEEYYETVDRGIGRMLDVVDDDCDVVVLSDHGFGPLTHDIYIDEWLEKEGFLARREQSSAKTKTDDVLGATVKAAWETLKSANLHGKVKSVVPSSWFDFGKSLQDKPHRDVVWTETQAFFTTLSGQALYVNTEGSFSEGAVPQHEYDEVIEEIRESLLSIRHPETGESLVEAVVRSDEVFEGPATETGPDLIVRTVPDHTLKGGFSESLLQSSAQNAHDRSGDHRSDGILIASGPSFRTGRVEDASVLDIAPILLYLQGCPIPTVMDGSLSRELFFEEMFDERAVRETEKYGRSESEGREWNAEEEVELEKRLSDMGYLG
ncbi:alkaline phosphatase family protein [Haloprofundus halophilus]|uniref:alkaline phosphatase family protein n=1 Tax=Haloprofundus halophilus TaxID=2283527 RepID=UPI000E430547|nr:alkaline phosphatase family protein [Haloprofundus halophilus]